jgi:5S rRNA maturation endonuclease (ribonuclease M5)
VLRPHVTKELEALAALGRPLVILTDPDERGRQLRGHLDAALAPLLSARAPPVALLHAFVPEASAVALEDGKVHAAGNRGIEHSVPRVLATALRAAAPGHPPGRAVWDLESLHRLRLARPFDGGAQPGAADEPRERRRRLCALLGLGKCSAAQLVAALNKYFDEATVEAALAALAALDPDHRQR